MKNKFEIAKKYAEALNNSIVGTTGLVSMNELANQNTSEDDTNDIFNSNEKVYSP